VCEQLRALPEAEPAPGLTERIVAALPAHAPRRRARRLLRMPGWRWAATAAGLLLAVGGAFRLVERLRPGRAGAGTISAACVGDACGWLANHQEADGSWRPAATAGSDAFKPALSALATLALAEAGGPSRDPAAVRGAQALLRMQRPDGGFGDPGPARSYNHAIATHTLFRFLPRAREIGPGLEDSLKRAVAYTRRTQSAEGGWDYTAGEPGNTALTVWQLDLLAQARAAGWGDPQGHLRRGLVWLSRQADPDGLFGYRTAGRPARRGALTMTAMAAWSLQTAGSDYAALVPTTRAALDALGGRVFSISKVGNPPDLYRDYFLIMALLRGGAANAAHAIRARVAARCTAAGADRGSWPNDDVWGGIGGKLYTTSMAVLSLTSGNHP
jgi:hypothetical protein